MSPLHSIAAAPEWLIAQRSDQQLLEGVAGEPWEVNHCVATRGVPHTDFGNRRMAVPSGGSDLSRVVRHHELLHALLSPNGVPETYIAEQGLSAKSIHLAEEIRINSVLKDVAKGLGLKISAFKDGSETREAHNAVATRDLGHAIHLLCASLGTGAEAGVSKILYPEFPELKKLKALLNKQLRELWQKNSTYPTAVYDEANNQYTIPRGFYATLTIARILEKFAKDEEENESQFAERVKSQIDNYRPSDEYNAWGNLVFGSVPLNESGSGFLSRTRSASATGRQPRRLHRLISDPDRKVFDRIARKRGGIVIVDGSGSMSLDENDLKEIVRAASGCTVAVYSFVADQPNIWVVAREGRYVAQGDFPPIGCDNVVDLPALEWGVKQRKYRKDPVIWVSDGDVTGIHRYSSIALAAQCATFIAKHKIIQVRNTQGAVEVLADFARGRVPTSPQFVGSIKTRARELKLID